MTPQIPYIIEGEVIEAIEKYDGDNRIFYTCRVMLPNGAITDINNVYVSSTYGGIGDYKNRRLRTRKDAEFKENSYEEKDLNASVGERVFIAFINGSMYHPVIIGFKEHPNQVDEIEDPKSAKPQSVEQFLGVREDIDEKGQWRLTVKGAPKVKFNPQTLPFSLPSLGGLDDTPKGDKSPALEPKDETNRLIIEVLEKAIFRVRDPEGGVIEIDHKGKKGVFFSNNDWKSSEDVEKSFKPESGGLGFDFKSVDAEYIHLDRSKEALVLSSRKITNIYSLKDRYDFTVGNHKIEVEGNIELLIKGDYKAEISGSKEETIEGDNKSTITGSCEYTSSGDMKMLSKTKVAFGTSQVEIFGKLSETLEQFGKLIQEITTAAPTFVNTAVGPGVLNPGLVAKLPEFTVSIQKLKTEIDSVKA